MKCLVLSVASLSLKITVSTWLKRSPVQSVTLLSNQKYPVQPGTCYPLAQYELQGDHYKVVLGKDSNGNQINLIGFNTWFVYAAHAQILQDGSPIVAATGKTNSDGLRLIKAFEGCRLTAYPDPGTGGDPWTIGFGHTGADVYPGLSISQERADALLVQDLQRFEAIVSRAVTTQVDSNQYSALVSFTYNTGALEGSTLLALLNQQDYQGAAEQFLRWVRAGGQVLPGLVRRRNAERALFLGQDYTRYL